MKQQLTFIIVIILVAILLPLTSCKKSEEVEQDFTMRVTVYNGISGTPLSGTYTYRKDDLVDYSYSLEPGYSDLRVTLDGGEIAASGTITVSGNHNLVVTAREGSGEFLLTVTVLKGAGGNPGTGWYYKNRGDRVDYNYSPDAGYTNLVVTLDTKEVPAGGSFTVTGDHILYVHAEVEYNITGTWTLHEEYSDGSSFSVTVSFNGDVRGGTVTDSDGGQGTYTVDGDDVTFTLNFPDVTYEYSGLFADAETMGGSCRRHTSADTYHTGDWLASRGSAQAGAGRHTAGKGSALK